MEQNQNNTSIEPPPIKVSLWAKVIGSGFFTGYTPFASGTVGSAVALLFFLIPNFQRPEIILPTSVVIFFLGGIAASQLERKHGHDPSIVTIDEFVGMWISMWFVPVTYLNVGVAFLIFRILDILKPYPAGDIDKQHGGWNIMLDDVIAGIYTNIILQVSLRFFN
jgi:phosphatidylglycerophosphatase A